MDLCIDWEIAESASKRTEQLILEQLNDLISRGLLEVVVSGPVFVEEEGGRGVDIRQSVKIVSREKEYIERLERENKELKDLIVKLRSEFT